MFAWNFKHYSDPRRGQVRGGGDYKKWTACTCAAWWYFFFVFFIPTFLAIQFGSEFVNNVVAAMPPVLTDDLKIASSIPPGSWNGHAAENDELLKSLVVFRPWVCFPSIWGG